MFTMYTLPRSVPKYSHLLWNGRCGAVTLCGEEEGCYCSDWPWPHCLPLLVELERVNQFRLVLTQIPQIQTITRTNGYQLALQWSELSQHGPLAVCVCAHHYAHHHHHKCLRKHSLPVHYTSFIQVLGPFVVVLVVNFKLYSFFKY